MDRYSHVYKGSPPDHCCCDQALRALPNGEWIAVFMTGGDNEPRKENYVALCRSGDRGRSWSRPQAVLRFPDRACLLSEVIVHGPEVRVFVVTHGGYFEDWRNFTVSSFDGGATWGEPVPFDPTPRRTFLRNLYASSWGEWFLPVQTYDVVPDPSPSPLRDGSIKLCMNGTLISSDEGRNWQKSSLVGPTAGFAENNLVELADGRMVMFIRADGQGCLLRSESGDRGRTWSQPRRTDVPNAGSKFRLHRLTDGRVVLLHNPNPQCGVRNPMSLWVSDDDVRTWAFRRDLFQFPGQLQYPDGFVDEAEGYVHFVFDYNRHDVIYWGAKLPD